MPTDTKIITDFADQIAARQYYKKDAEGNPVEDYEGMLRRVARHVARAEAIDAFKRDNGRYPEWYMSFEGRKKNLLDLVSLDMWIEDQGYTELCKEWEKKFFDLMITQKFSPGGRILAGAESQYGNLSNCFVLEPNGRYLARAKDDADSIDGIYELSYKLAKVTKMGGGCGVNLDFMRESGAYVAGSGGRSSGPVSFLRLNYNTTLRVIKLEGVRRGAGMATLSIDHPDALDFITAKDADREAIEGKIEAFNISLLVTEKFMEAVQNDSLWHFRSVATGDPVEPTPVMGKYHLPHTAPTSVDGNPNSKKTSVQIPIERPTNKTPGVRARWLWNEVISHAWESGDPGIIFIDTINDLWPLHEAVGPISATNPCGEEPLAPGESCCLGSMILDRYVSDSGVFKFPEFEKDVALAVRFLDDVLTITTHPLEDTQEWCDRLRRVGLGVMGDAAMFMKMGVGYTSDNAYAIRHQIALRMAEVSQEASEKLAEEKGTFPFWDKVDSHLDIPARRNVHTLSIAPTGTISMVTDTTSGIEPLFALAMQRRVGNEYKFRLDPTFENYLVTQRPDINLHDESTFVPAGLSVGHDATGKSIRQSVMVPEVVKAIMENHGGIVGLDRFFSEQEQRVFVTAHDVSPEDHVLTQAAWQAGMDAGDMVGASISKTTNLPGDASVEDVKQVYELAFKRGLKGITIYRDGSKTAQVLRTDLEEEKEEPATEKAEPARLKVSEPKELGEPSIHRPRETEGKMTKAEFRDANGRERKVYIFVGKNNYGYPVEVFITDEEGGHDVHPYAASLGKMVSTALKYGAPADKVAKKLRKIEGGSVSYGQGIFQSIPAKVGALLQEAVDDYKKSLGIDPTIEKDCDGNCQMVSQGGCEVCLNCGMSKCS